ncbi:MAG: tRNA (adenosine(37)-N6)-dimethylallyltransferase MiaA [Bacteroidales bacterium]
MPKKLILILGPTASGKTDYSISLAKEVGSPVVSCDSRQIYKEMKIGTAPPSDEQLAQIQHYFIFSHSIHNPYTAGKYEIEAISLLEKLFEKHDTIVAAGGSGLYAHALCHGLDDFPPADEELRRVLTARLESEGLESLRADLRLLDRESYDSIEIENSRRVMRALEVTIQTGRKFSSFKTGVERERPFVIEKRLITRSREELYNRIDKRVDLMIESGLLDEVKSLYKFKDLPALRTVGYSELFDFLDGRVSLEEAVSLIKRNTRRYAKRQITWWRRYTDLKII